MCEIFSDFQRSIMALIFVLLLIFVRVHTLSTSGDHLNGSDPQILPSASSYSPQNFTDTAETSTLELPSTTRKAAAAITDDDWTPLFFLNRKAPVARFIPALDKECSKLLQNYAQFSSDFVYCALAFSKPNFLCETCVILYKTVDAAYREIEKKKSCGDSLLHSDRIQVLMETHFFAKKLWEKGSCQKCFNDLDNCSIEEQCPVKDNVVKFQKYNRETVDCFRQAAAANENVCSNCSALYRQLNTWYKSMGSVDDICFDCVEQMNSTRKEWSTVYNCTRTRKDIVSIVAVSCFFCSLPLFFYFGVKIHTVKSEYKLMTQSRLKKPHRTTGPRLPRLPQHGEAFLTDDSTSNTNN